MKQRKQSIFGELHMTVHISQASELLEIPAHELNNYFVDCKVLSGVARPNCTNVSIRNREPVPLLKNAQ